MLSIGYKVTAWPVCFELQHAHWEMSTDVLSSGVSHCAEELWRAAPFLSIRISSPAVCGTLIKVIIHILCVVAVTTASFTYFESVEKLTN